MAITVRENEYKGVPFQRACEVCRTMPGWHVVRHAVYRDMFDVARNKRNKK
jgi:hypothetical protein